MPISTVDFSDISEQLGDYVVTLKHIGHAVPLKPDIIPHKHTIFELHFIESGKGVLYTNEREYKMSDGMLCVTGPGIFHGQRSDSDNPMSEYCLRFDLEYQPKTGSDKAITELMRLIAANTFYVSDSDLGGGKMIREMLTESSLSRPGFKLRIQLLLTDYLVKLGRLYMQSECKGDISRERIEFGERDFKATIDRCLFTYDKPLSIAEIIAELHITPRHFGRLMQKYYGMSYTAKINELRVEYAKQLLVKSTLSSEQIGQRVGFSSAQSFTKAFKNLVGTTPGRFRKDYTE